MAFETWLVFGLAYFLVTLSPGPNVLLVITHAVKYGYPKIFTTILANLTCQLGIVIMIATGVGALVTVDSLAFKVIKFAGAGYLIYLGVTILYKLWRDRGLTPVAVDPNAAPTVRGFGSRYRQAFFVSAGNPKTVVFLAAFLPQFLDHHAPLAPQFLLMYLTIAMTVLSVHSVYGWLAVKVKQRVVSARVRRTTSAATGFLYIFLGGRLSVS